MKRADKQAILQKALRGQYIGLRKLHKERLRDSMPYLDIHGVIDANNCPDALLEVGVYHDDIDKKMNLIPARQFIRRLADRIGFQKWSIGDSAIAMLDASDNQYDLVPLHSFQLTTRNHSRYNVAGGTIGDLRRYFSRCADSIDKPYIGLFFDDNPRETIVITHTELPQ